ncbi:hypothetical protein BCR33DRAFT_856464 [Rhizoclosmatium globosum]|uniref:BIR-domain-containing protein n=1 Tax=Rhizoclosmatium globosum TaxID=329046 RepID=A0A1Y2BD52_9FUNG|nr:hypothetical protein BCR33DRAFT_856464 [Rhizoclosmatium globosum]|eukprot:ORY32753.1 hypothetical protein BCR33DRAFT_856464 [Rhizoclosmatium globosum]
MTSLEAERAWVRQVHSVFDKLLKASRPDAKSLSSLVTLSVIGRSSPWSAEAKQARAASFTAPVLVAPAKGRRKTIPVEWPHSGDANWGCSAEKIAETGMFFKPQSVDENDYALCQYCLLGLAGWESTDDPVFEHKKRSPDCIMFKGPRVFEKLGPSVIQSLEAEAAEMDKDEVESVIELPSAEHTAPEPTPAVPIIKPTTAKTTASSTATKAAATTKPKAAPTTRKPRSISTTAAPVPAPVPTPAPIEPTEQPNTNESESEAPPAKITKQSTRAPRVSRTTKATAAAPKTAAPPPTITEDESESEPAEKVSATVVSSSAAPASSFTIPTVSNDARPSAPTSQKFNFVIDLPSYQLDIADEPLETDTEEVPSKLLSPKRKREPLNNTDHEKSDEDDNDDGGRNKKKGFVVQETQMPLFQEEKERGMIVVEDLVDDTKSSCPSNSIRGMTSHKTQEFADEASAPAPAPVKAPAVKKRTTAAASKEKKAASSKATVVTDSITEQQDSMKPVKAPAKKRVPKEKVVVELKSVASEESHLVVDVSPEPVRESSNEHVGSANKAEENVLDVEPVSDLVHTVHGNSVAQSDMDVDSGSQTSETVESVSEEPPTSLSEPDSVDSCVDASVEVRAIEEKAVKPAKIVPKKRVAAAKGKKAGVTDQTSGEGVASQAPVHAKDVVSKPDEEKLEKTQTKKRVTSAKEKKVAVEPEALVPVQEPIARAAASVVSPDIISQPVSQPRLNNGLPFTSDVPTNNEQTTSTKISGIKSIKTSTTVVDYSKMIDDLDNELLQHAFATEMPSAIQKHQPQPMNLSIVSEDDLLDCYGASPEGTPKASAPPAAEPIAFASSKLRNIAVEVEEEEEEFQDASEHLSMDYTNPETIVREFWPAQGALVQRVDYLDPKERGLSVREWMRKVGETEVLRILEGVKTVSALVEREVGKVRDEVEDMEC